MGALLSLAVELYEINCGECGGVYAITEKYRVHKYDIGGSWHCPYCQVGWGYSGKGKLQLAEKALAEEKARKTAALARANELEAKLAVEVEMARLKAMRAKNGTCPCCTRTFKQLAAHMKNKHPEYTNG